MARKAHNKPEGPWSKLGLRKKKCFLEKLETVPLIDSKVVFQHSVTADYYGLHEIPLFIQGSYRIASKV